MPSFKTLELINSLTENESARFEKFIAFTEPETGSGSELRSLFHMLRKDKKISRKQISMKLYGSAPHNDKKIRYLISDLNKQIQNYIRFKKLESSPFLSNIITASALQERACHKSYNYIHQLLTSRLFKKNATYQLHMFEHHEQHINYESRLYTRKSQPDYTPTLEHLDVFYIQKKLQLACELTNMSNILRTEQSITLLSEVKKLATLPPYNEDIHIKIYYHIHETLLNSENEDAFSECRTLLKSSGDLIDPSELTEMYQYIKNFCVAKINRGNTSYTKILFNIYKDMLNNESLLNHDYMSQWEYKNIVTISLRAGEKVWCSHFIKQFINYLRPEERQNAFAYNTAYYNFISGEYNKAIKKLQEVSLNDVFYQLDSRAILLKSYYELHAFESFFYQSSSFRLFLQRNKNLSAYQKTIYRNLIKFLTAIARSSLSKTKLNRLRKEIITEKNVADPDWLLSKLDHELSLHK